jgi:hypothetical protein
MQPSEFIAVADQLISALKKSIEHIETAKSVVTSEPATAEFHFQAALRDLKAVVDAAGMGSTHH